MTRARLIIGDALAVLPTLAPASVDLAVCSPPFLALRSYLPADHPDKQLEHGSEPTPAAFLATLLDVTEQIGRVLSPHGSIAVELGDTYCVDADTEILTRAGWKTWDAVQVGDVALTINPSTQLAGWQPITDLHIYPPTRRRMLSVEGRSMSALVTPNHRWLVNQRVGGNQKRARRWEFRTSETLTLDSSIPTAAPLIDLPAEPKYSDALVEAVAWYWTEGHDRKPGVGRFQQTGIYIAQSYRVNPGHVARIRACLTGLFGPPSTRLPGVKNAGPAWREDAWPSAPDKAEFRLNAAAARVLREHAPGKVPQTEWLATLTQAQLDLFIERSIDADGQRTTRGVGLAQKDRARASAFQTACLLAGRSASLNRRQSNCEMWAVTLNSGLQRKPLRQASRQWVEYDGLVWCPTTSNGTWMARRRGTTYFTGNSGSGGAGGDYMPDGMRAGQPGFDGSARRSLGGKATREAGYDGNVRRKQVVQKEGGGRMTTGNGWPLPKSLCGVPAAYQLSLAYGRNILALPGDPEWREFAPWRVRNLVAWVRTNPPVGALGDKWRPASSYVTVATRSATRWWDDIATRQPYAPLSLKNHGGVGTLKGGEGNINGPRDNALGRMDKGILTNPAGAPLLDWWNITPTGYTSRLGAHYATFPDDLVTPLVQAMCPRRVCRTCGTPSRRITKLSERYAERIATHKWASGGMERGHAKPASTVGWEDGSAVSAEKVTVGWSSCSCPGADGVRDDGYHDGPAWRPGVVLDPYCGTGSTLVVATGHGRDAVGVDLNPANAALAEERLGMFVDIETHTPEAAA